MLTNALCKRDTSPLDIVISPRNSGVLAHRKHLITTMNTNFVVVITITTIQTTLL